MLKDHFQRFQIVGMDYFTEMHRGTRRYTELNCELSAFLVNLVVIFFGTRMTMIALIKRININVATSLSFRERWGEANLKPPRLWPPSQRGE